MPKSQPIELPPGIRSFHAYSVAAQIERARFLAPKLHAALTGQRQERHQQPGAKPETRKDAEKALQAAGFTRKEARAFCSEGYMAARQAAGLPEHDDEETAAALGALADALKGGKSYE